MGKNANMLEAKKQKNDEFYTQMADIEAELPHYFHQLQGKLVFCNCDDPERSNFWRYFDKNFDTLGLKGLVATHLVQNGRAYKVEIQRNEAGERQPSTKTELKGNGDFRSPECMVLLDACDVVITNPPFSLFREYLLLMMEHHKRFLVIGNQNQVASRAIFPLLMDNLVWSGYTKPKRFLTPNGELRSFGNVIWFTNIDIEKRHEPLPLPCRYKDNPAAYPAYDNYEGINIRKLSEIPGDFLGVMGVPITFLDKHCPTQFKIVGAGTSPEFFTPTKRYIRPKRHNLDGTTERQHIAINQTVTIASDEKPKGLYYTAENSDKYLTSPYCRIFIQRVQQQ